MRLIFPILVFFLMLSCAEEEKVKNQPPIPNFQFKDGIDKIIFDGGSSSDPEGQSLSYSWSSTSSKIIFSNSLHQTPSVKIPPGDKDEMVDITLVVSDGVIESSITQSVKIPVLTQSRAFGLGIQVLKETSNSVKYEWYYDQGFTGNHSNVNCGPASVTMAIKWAKQDFTKTPEDARNRLRSSGGWWYTGDIIFYLNSYDITNWTISLSNMQDDLKTEIDNGNIVILCLDMYWIGYNPNEEQRVDKFYETSGVNWGHFIVIKGYKDVDNQTFFEAYDPYCFGLQYLDLNPKGKDRYYKTVYLKTAAERWWNYAIVVSRNPSTGGRKGVNTDEIVHMPGR